MSKFGLITINASSGFHDSHAFNFVHLASICFVLNLSTCDKHTELP